MWGAFSFPITFSYLPFWLRWVSVAVHGLFSSCREWGANLCCALRASHCRGFSCCIARALGCMDFSSWGEQAQLPPRHLESSQTRAGIKPVPPLVGRFLPSGPQGKSCRVFFTRGKRNKKEGQGKRSQKEGQMKAGGGGVVYMSGDFSSPRLCQTA